MFRKLKAMARRHAERKAEAERQEAVAPLLQAVKRGDTRGQHDRYPAAFEATCASLAVSVGKRPMAWRGR